MGGQSFLAVSFACRVIIIMHVFTCRASWSYSYVHPSCVVSSSGGDAE
jgi:hypothetical protein